MRLAGLPRLEHAGRLHSRSVPAIVPDRDLGMTSAMLTPPELVWLLAAVAKGDQAAFERLYAATRTKLYGVVLRILRRSDLADEVIQETYLKIWHNAGSFDPKLATPITWMVAIARNRALDLVRKKRESSIEDEPAASGSSRKTGGAWCCSPTIVAGAASSWR
jgi:Sigma-70 region 2